MVEHTTSIDVPLCRSYSCIWVSQAFSSCLASAPGMFHFGDKIVCNTPQCLESTFVSHMSPPNIVLFCTMSNALSSINKLWKLYNSLWAASAGVIAFCLISNSCRLPDPTNSPSLGVVAAQHALIMTNHVVHRSFFRAHQSACLASCRPISHLYALQSVPTLAVTSAHVSLRYFNVIPSFNC